MAYNISRNGNSLSTGMMRRNMMDGLSDLSGSAPIMLVGGQGMKLKGIYI
jgi:hypothetical protein